MGKPADPQPAMRASRAPCRAVSAVSPGRAWLERIEQLLPAERVEFIVRKLAARFSEIAELIEILNDVLAGHPTLAGAALVQALIKLPGLDLAKVRDSVEKRRSDRLRAQEGIRSVELLDPSGERVGVKIDAPGYACRPFTLPPNEADLLAILLEHRGIDRFGLAEWRRIKDVQRAMRQRAKRRADVSQRKDSPRRRRSSRTGSASIRGRSRPRPGGGFRMTILRLRRAIEHAGGNRWWVQSDSNGRIRLAIRRVSRSETGGLDLPNTGTDR